MLYKSSINKASNKTKAAWSIINNYTSDYTHSTLQAIKVNDIAINDPQTICNSFNDFFLDNIIKNCPSTMQLSDTDSCIETIDGSIFLNPTTMVEVMNIVRKLKNSNAVGFDDIRTDIIKLSIDIIAHPITFIINRCLLEGVFPDSIKKTIVKPIFKKGDRLSMDNYRPIALISILSKILEK